MKRNALNVRIESIGKRLPSVFITAFVLLQISCSAPKTTTSYTEDLSPNRPKFNVDEPTVAAKATEPNSATVVQVTPTKHVNKKVDLILDSIDRINITKKYVDGFTIQIYSGPRREDALNAKAKMNYELSDLSSSLQYVQPKFKVTVGSYITRIEAQKDFVRLKHYFSTAILIPERILIK